MDRGERKCDELVWFRKCDEQAWLKRNAQPKRTAQQEDLP